MNALSGIRQPEIPAAADSRVSAMGGVSQNGKEQSPLSKKQSGRHVSAVVRRGCTHKCQEGKVLDADRIKAAEVDAMQEMILCPLRDSRLKKPSESSEFPAR